MALKWLADIFRSSGLSEYESFAARICDALLRIGVDAQAAGRIIEVRGSPIARVRFEVKSSSSYSGDGADKLYLHCEIPDSRLTKGLEELHITARKIKTSWFFGKLIGIRWVGNDIGLGMLDRLNNDDSLTGQNDFLLDSLGGFRIRARRWFWELKRADNWAAPVKAEWESYERIALYLLQTPIIPLSHSQMTIGSIAFNDFPMQMKQPNQILTMLVQRSWLWRFLGLTRTGQTRCLERITAVQEILPTIIVRLVEQFVFEPTERTTSAYLIGSYPWVPNPADVDLLVVVEGQFDWTIFTPEELQDRGVRVPELSAEISLEIVGSETLLQAKQGEQVVDAKRVALRHTLIYGSVLLAGDDIFEGEIISAEDLHDLRNDLLQDRKQANWPELAGDPARTKAKRKWRKAESDALRKFRSQLSQKSDKGRKWDAGQTDS